MTFSSFFISISLFFALGALNTKSPRKHESAIAFFFVIAEAKLGDAEEEKLVRRWYGGGVRRGGEVWGRGLVYKHLLFYEAELS